MSLYWYALRVKPHKEQSVHNLLLNKQIEVFYPSLQIKPKNPRASKIRPYFPGYMFVHLDLDSYGLNALSWTPGTSGLVNFGGEPAVVPENLIYEIRKHLLHHEKELQQMTIFRPGDKVRIIGGPFEGYEAIFDFEIPGQQRVQVLLAFLSQFPQRLRIDRNQLERVV